MQVAEKLSTHFIRTRNENPFYVLKYIICNGLSVAILAMNFVATDKILLGDFLEYGMKPERMCATFPSLVSCTMPKMNFRGKVISTNGLCILGQNLLNQKMYFVLWYAYLLVGICCIVDAIFMLSMCGCMTIRLTYFSAFLKKKNRASGKNICKALCINDWFMLNQMRKNLNVEMYNDVVSEIGRLLRDVSGEV